MFLRMSSVCVYVCLCMCVYVYVCMCVCLTVGDTALREDRDREERKRQHAEAGLRCLLWFIFHTCFLFSGSIYSFAVIAMFL